MFPLAEINDRKSLTLENYNVKTGKASTVATYINKINVRLD